MFIMYTINIIDIVYTGHYTRMCIQDKEVHHDDSHSLATFIGVGVALGAGVGAAFGTAMDNIAVGVGIGPAIGIAVAVAIWSARQTPTDREDPRE